MSTRAEKKRQSLQRILDVASVRLREQGLGGAGIAAVMQEAGLTHGAFYSHFTNKDELSREAFKYALEEGQARWFGDAQEPWRARLKRLAATYLRGEHRDDVGHGCAISALVTDIAAADPAFHETFETALLDTLQKVCECEDDVPEAQKFDDAIAFLALCVGGLNFARAVDDPALSERILGACKTRACNMSGIIEPGKEL